MIPEANAAKADDRMTNAGGGVRAEPTDGTAGRAINAAKADDRVSGSEEVHFENRLFFTPKTLRPVYRKLTPRWMRYFFGLCLVIGIVGFWMLDSENGEIPLLTLLLMVIGLYSLLGRPYALAWEAARNHRKLMNDRLPEAVVRYTDTEISGLEARNRTFYSYDQIRGVRSTRHMWLLMIDNRIALMVDKEGFSKGRAADFPAFIRSKCPGIKGTFK